MDEIQKGSQNNNPRSTEFKKVQIDEFMRERERGGGGQIFIQKGTETSADG